MDDKPQDKIDLEEAVDIYLRHRGVAERVLKGGLAGLVVQWEGIVESVSHGYRLDTLDDYLNDMDVRQLLHDCLERVPAAKQTRFMQRIESADKMIKAKLIPAGRCLWGREQAARSRWTAEKQWWYFMQPARPGPGLRKDIASWNK